MHLKNLNPHAIRPSSRSAGTDSRDSGSEAGFTLIELLVVILIIGILAAIAIPTFLAQKNKASDADAKELARTAYNAAEVFATDHNSEYSNLTAEELHNYEPAIQTTNNGGAYLSSVTAGEHEFTVTATAPDKHEFTITRTSAGEVTRTCTLPSGKPEKGANAGGCQEGTW